MRSKGLLQDFAYGQLGRVRQARARAYSGGADSNDEEENKDYDMIRGENPHALFLPAVFKACTMSCTKYLDLVPSFTSHGELFHGF